MGIVRGVGRGLTFLLLNVLRSLVLLYPIKGLGIPIPDFLFRNMCTVKDREG